MSKKTAVTQTRKPEDYLKQPYARVLIPEPEGGFAAEVLEFPGCYSFGDTAEEALQNLEDAALSWIEAAVSQGQHIPEPSDSGEASGKVALRLPRNLHRKASQVAERNRVSLNTFLVDAIAARVGAQDLLDRLVQHLDERLAMLEVRAQAVTTSAIWDKALDALLNPQSRSTVNPQGTDILFLYQHKPLEVKATHG
jgi:predicted RNase H-like HicB family nuclease